MNTIEVFCQRCLEKMGTIQTDAVAKISLAICRNCDLDIGAECCECDGGEGQKLKEYRNKERLQDG